MNVYKNKSKDANIVPNEREGLHYISPEFLEDTENSSKEMVLWALGCIIYHMKSGKKPFHGNTRGDIIKKILSKNLEWTKIENDGKEV